MSNEEKETTIEKVLERIEAVEVAYDLEACVLLHVLNGKVSGLVHPVFDNIKAAYWLLQRNTAPRLATGLFEQIAITGAVPDYKDALREAWANEELRPMLQELLAWRMCALVRLDREVGESVLLGLETIFDEEE